jgi:hypothetical protein
MQYLKYNLISTSSSRYSIWISLQLKRLFRCGKKIYPHNGLAKELLDIAVDVLNNKTDIETARKTWKSKANQVEDEATDPQNLAEKRAACALFAIHWSLRTVVGIEPLDDDQVDVDTTDMELDPWLSDTAKWAVAAYGGFEWDDDVEALKRCEFWKWWIKEAIPTAWELANNNHNRVEFNHPF